MTNHFAENQTPGQPLRSQVIGEPLGPLVVGAVLVGGALLVLPAGTVVWSYSRLAGGLLVLLGVGLLAMAGRLATRNTCPLLLTLSPEALHLAPLGRNGPPASAAETIPLASIVAYKHWLSRGRVFSRYYLRLELADGRVLRLADPPGVLPNDPMGTVLLSELVAQLARWVGSDTVVQPLFFETLAARRLMQGNWLAVLAAPGLLWDGYLTVGILLLAFAAPYLLSYYQAQRQARHP